MFEFLIQDIGDYKQPTARTDDPKYKVIGFFLTTEANTASAAAAWLQGIEQIQAGKVEEWGGGGEVYIIEMTRQSVTISWGFVDDPPPDRFGVYDFDEFAEIYHAWLDFLREHGRYPPPGK